MGAYFMKRLFTCVAAASFAVAASVASASTIDLTGLGDNVNQSTFGNSQERVFAQSLQADDATFESLRVDVSATVGGTFDLLITGVRAAGLPGTGFAPDATNELFRQELTHTGGGLEMFEVALNLPVTAGDHYFFVLAAFGKTLAASSVRATRLDGPDQYPFGEFIFSSDAAPFSNTIGYTSRFSREQDLAFRASFGPAAAIPLPATLPLLAAGVLAFGLIGRRRR